MTTEPGILLAEADARREATRASNALNARCWAMYRRLAERHGLDHPLVAAVQCCGMRAA